MNKSAKIFYIVGASGAGKDSILSAYRQSGCYSKNDLVVAHRYITREPTLAVQSENFISLTNEEFNFRENNNFFSLSWKANNCFYGIGTEINIWLSYGLSVIVNGSRSYLPVAKNRYPDKLVSVAIEVSDEIIRERLVKRQRESLAEIDSRILRHRELKHLHQADEAVVNNTTIDNAVDYLSQIINKHKK